MSDTRETCLVTGGAGFIGSHLAAALVDRDFTVRVVDNLSTGRRANLAAIGPRIEFLEGDLADPDVAHAATADIDIVFHLAALPSVPLSFDEPWRAHDSNVNATVRLLEACRARHTPRFVFSGSCAVYGNAPEIPKRESMAATAASPYAAAKLASEQYALSYARAGLLHAVGLRYFNVFGPRQDPESPYSAVIPRFLAAAARDEPVTIFGDGLQTRDFVYVSNVVDANLLAAWTPRASGHVFNVGSGQQTSLIDLLGAVRATTNTTVRCRFEPARAGDVRHSVADVRHATAMLGYRPTVTLADGLRRTWESMRQMPTAVRVPQSALGRTPAQDAPHGLSLAG